MNQLECLLLLRANLIPEYGHKPCWFWLTKIKLNASNVLLYLACADDHPSVREASLAYASKLNLPLRQPRRGKRSIIHVIADHDAPATRKAALQYLAQKGTATDLPLIEKMRTDSDNDVRTAANNARSLVRLRDDASLFFRSSILNTPWLGDEEFEALQAHIARIEPQLLKEALSDPDEKIQRLASGELAARALITVEEIRSLKGTDVACVGLQA